jgi:hypothetical protein
MLSAFDTVCPHSSTRPNEHWISSRSAALIEARKALPASTSHDNARRSLKRRITKSLRNDRERWWIAKARDMEKAFATGNSRALFELIRSTGPRKSTVSETIDEKDGSKIYSLGRRLERWAEHFQEQFNWPPTNQHLHHPSETVWNIDLHCPTEGEVSREISLLKRDKTPGPDGLHPALFKEGGATLVTELTRLLQRIWTEEKVPEEWSTSTIIPIFKKGARTLCENHRGISLVAVASKVLSGLILRRLINYRESQIRENQCGFSSCPGMY